MFVVETASTGFYYGNVDLPDKRLILFIASYYQVGKIDLLLKVKDEKNKRASLPGAYFLPRVVACLCHLFDPGRLYDFGQAFQRGYRAHLWGR